MPPDEDAAEDTEHGQLALLPELARARATAAQQAAAARAREAAPVETAPEHPVARVLVDVPLAHLDRPFDYLVPAADDETARPGVRVRVRFAGQLVGGYLLVSASGMDEAVDLGKGCPIFDHEGSVEVRPIMEMQM